MIDKNELLKQLPRLIREDDEIKGAIISALSGVVTTKDDIKSVIELLDKRFEAMDKRFEALQKQINERFEAVQIQINTDYKELRSAIDNLGGRVGRGAETMVLKLLKQYNKIKDVEISQLEQKELIDEGGIIFTKGYRTDVDILMDNGKTILIEIKFKADNRDIYHFVQVGKLYEHLYTKPDELWLLTFEISPKNFEVAAQFPVKLIYGRIKK